MDPNHWSNYNQLYSRLGHAGGIPATHSTINRYVSEMSLLEQAAGLGPGLPGLSPTLPPHSSLASSGRTTGTVPTSYSHPLHGSVSAQYLDSVNALQSPFAISQNPYKTVGQSPFPFEPIRTTSEQQPLHSLSRYAMSGTMGSGTSHTKSGLFGQDMQLAKDPVSAYASSLVSQNVGDLSSKNWSLPNFVPVSSMPFGNVTDLGGSEYEPSSPVHVQQVPPPAHSSNQRMSTIQRNPYQITDPVYSDTSRSIKSLTSHLHSPYDRNPESEPLHLSLPPSAHTYSTSQEIDLTIPQSNPNQNLYSPYTSSVTSGYTRIASTTSAYSSAPSGYTTSHLPADMDYDPVSPATPLSDTDQHDNFSTMSLQDLANIEARQEKMSKSQETAMLSETSHIMKQANVLHNLHQEMRVSQQMPGTPNGQSPLQHSPISVGGSPQQAPMSMGSPQAPMPSSTVVQVPPTVQAIADSTTKPKRGRGRRKKESVDIIKQSPVIQRYSDSMSPEHNITAYNQSLQMQSMLEQNYVPPIKRYLSNSHHADQKQPSPLQDNRMSLTQTGMPENLVMSPHSGGMQNTDSLSLSSSPMSASSLQMAQQPLSESVIRSTHSSPLSKTDSLSVMEGIANSPLQSRPQVSDNMSLSHSLGMSGSLLSEPQRDLLERYDDDDRTEPQQSLLEQYDDRNRSEPQQGMFDGDQHEPQQRLLEPYRDVDRHKPQPNLINRFGDEDGHVTEPNLLEQFSDQERHGPQPRLLDRFASGEGQAYGMEQQYLERKVEEPIIPRSFDLPEQVSNNPSQASFSPAQDLYMTNEFGNSFMNPGNDLESVGTRSSPSQTQSTIDAAAFSHLMGESLETSSPEETPMSEIKEEQKEMPHVQTVTASVEIDDDLCHLAQAPKVPEEQNTPLTKTSDIINTSPTNKAALYHNAFQNSYLSFLQGKKPETLASAGNSATKKPQLPKYIPEPRRTRPVEEPKASADESSDSSQNDDAGNSTMTFSEDDDENSVGNIDSAVKSAISNLSDDDAQRVAEIDEHDDLKVKISLKRVPKAIRGKLRGPKSKQMRVQKAKRGKAKTRYVEEFDSVLSNDEGELAVDVEPPVLEEPEIALRRTSARKAKDKVNEKREKKQQKKQGIYVGSDSEVFSDSSLSDHIKPIVASDEEKDYDSDRDPVWTPFAADNKRQPVYDMQDFSESPKRNRGKRKGIGKGRFRGRGRRASYGFGSDSLTPPKLDRIPSHQETDAASHDGQDSQPVAKSQPEEPPGVEFQVGRFLLERKDLNNYESYPIWKIESGRMLHKYELFTEEGKIRHRSIPTFSSWVPSLRHEFKPIEVRMVVKMREKEVVEVVDEYKPKPELDSSLENEYEEDPLSDLFNVYLQTFLSQSLEPGFLCAIKESVEDFYLGPLNKIDRLIDRKLKEIDCKVNWRSKFQDYLKARPHLRELDRPNLKQSCQACEHASQPAIKSVHLFGQPYDRFSLEELPSSTDTSTVAQEFMIGKTAAQYVGWYHSLYHFKYNLYKRCLARVKIIRESNPEGNLENAEILDQCLQNRTWVLKIFEDLKNLLEKG